MLSVKSQHNTVLSQHNNIVYLYFPTKSHKVLRRAYGKPGNPESGNGTGIRNRNRNRNPKSGIRNRNK